METLAQSLSASETAAPAAAAGAAPPDAADSKPVDNRGKSSAADTIALALASQSLAAALGLPAVTPPMAPAPAVPTADATTGGAPDAVSLPGRSSIQDLVSLLTQSAGADSKRTSGADAPQVDVVADKPLPAADAGATTASASYGSMGIASHFPVQHSQPHSNIVTGELRAPLGTPAWSDELGGQITWMAHQGLEAASLRLSPDHLGPLEVHISVRDGDASVWFGAAHPDTRAALEQALPRLREMFAAQGLTLADSGVSRESPRNQARPSSANGIAPLTAVGSADLPASSAARISLGLVDTYA